MAELAWFQYKAANDAIRSSLNKISKDKIFCIEYDDFLENRPAYIKALCSFCEIPFGRRMQDLCSKSDLPLSRYTLDAPSKDKWMMNAIEIQSLLPQMHAYIEKQRQLFPPSI